MPLTKLDVDQLPNVNLNRYSTLILVNGNYSGLSKETTKIEQWVQNGGTLIAYQDAIKWLNTAKLIELTLKQIKMKLKTLALRKRMI
jgi:arginine/lysine/ornithine decarboxylase